MLTSSDENLLLSGLSSERSLRVIRSILYIRYICEKKRQYLTCKACRYLALHACLRSERSGFVYIFISAAKNIQRSANAKVKLRFFSSHFLAVLYPNQVPNKITTG